MQFDIYLDKSMSYSDYEKLIKDCVINKKTTGDEQSTERIDFTKLNASRMRRLDKTIQLTDAEIEQLKHTHQQTWLVISEAWCGDAAQNLPVLHKIAEVNPMVDLRIVLRDENIELMNAFLTSGGQAIPKLIILDENKNVINTWGPRSTNATQLVQEYKKEFGKIDAKFKTDLQKWYNKDKGTSIIEDFIKMNKN